MDEFRENNQEHPENDEKSSEKLFFERSFEFPKVIKGKSGNIVLATDEGLKRNNEDVLVLDTDSDAFAVVDGMGGYELGEIAARVVGEAIEEDFKKPNADPVDLRSRAELQMADEGVKKGGAVYLACRIEKDGKGLQVYKAGDAELIVVSGIGEDKGKIKFWSEPTPLNDALSPSSSHYKAGKSKIERAELKNYDYIIAATDGLWKSVDKEEVAVIVAVTNDKIETALTKLYVEAIRNMKTEPTMGDRFGNCDNISIIIYQILPVPLREK